MHEITAIIPTYNRAALLPRAIDSVLRQTVVPDQILIVDDGSTDERQQRFARLMPARWNTSDKGKLRESCTMWELVYRNGAAPDEFRRLLQFISPVRAGDSKARSRRRQVRTRYFEHLQSDRVRSAVWVVVARSWHRRKVTNKSFDLRASNSPCAPDVMT